MFRVDLHWKYHPPGGGRAYYAECTVFTNASDEKMALESAKNTLDLETVSEVFGKAYRVYTGTTNAIRSKLANRPYSSVQIL